MAMHHLLSCKGELSEFNAAGSLGDFKSGILHVHLAQSEAFFSRVLAGDVIVSIEGCPYWNLIGWTSCHSKWTSYTFCCQLNQVGTA